MSPRVNRRLEAERARLAAIDHRARMEAAERRSAHLRPPVKPNRGGRPRALTPRQVKWVRSLVVVRGEGTIVKAAAKLGVSPETVRQARKSVPAGRPAVAERKLSSPTLE